MSSLVDHVSRLYARRAYHRHISDSARAQLAAHRNEPVPQTVDNLARHESMRELRVMAVQLARVKPKTLEHLHQRMHAELGSYCTDIGDDWYPTLITEDTSLEDAMATKATKPQKEKTTKAEVRYVPDAKIGEVWAKAQMGLPEGFMNPDEMELIDMPGFVAARRAPNHPRNLETIYNFYQKIDGAPEERTEQLKVRSMSTGDAIVIDGVAYYVAMKGFVTKAPDGTITPVEAPEA